MSAATLQPLFDPVELLAGDGPRARRGDRVQSHMAADRSQRTMHRTKVAVLRIVAEQGEVTGVQINELFEFNAARGRWAKVAYDTPRKRAGELAVDGFLSFREQTAAGNNLPEAVYSITDKGREVLKEMS